jgi:hypothetical protein
MNLESIEADLKKDWPKLAALILAFTPTGWAIIILVLFFLFLMAQSWYVFLFFGCGVYVGYTQRTHIEEVIRPKKPPNTL